MTEAETTFTEDIPAEPQAHDDSLVLHLSSYEGPIDVLLQLARDQKVDLSQISILQLARQYLAFIDRAQELSLDVAAEYLVMAAWLAYLKSRLLLPRDKEEEDEPSAEMMAEALAFQLQRLEAIQSGSQKMARRMREYLTVYGRGHKEIFKAPEPDKYTVDLYQLLKAYGDITQRKTSTQYKPVVFPVMSMEEALTRMTLMLGRLPKTGDGTGKISVWTTLQSFMPENVKEVLLHKSSMASLFTASLELAKQGKLEIRQEENFKPIYLRVVEREAYVPEIPLSKRPNSMSEAAEEIEIEEEEFEVEIPEEPKGEIIPLEDPIQQKRVIEALLFASPEPVSLRSIHARLPSTADVGAILLEIQSDYAERGVHLVQLEDVWAFRTAPDIGPYLSLTKKEEKKLSRAALETMAIIAYHQPVTRAEVENIRGVATNKGTLDVLMESGWIKPGRRRETPGRPVTWTTTNNFLDDFGISNLNDLPGLNELKASGLLDTRPAIDTIGADLFNSANENISEEEKSEPLGEFDQQTDETEEEDNEMTTAEMANASEEENDNILAMAADDEETDEEESDEDESDEDDDEDDDDSDEDDDDDDDDEEEDED